MSVYQYPEWKKRINQWTMYLWPVFSERLFIHTLGRLWLWSHGYRHQVRIGAYIADFATDHLVIEVDGRSKVPKDIVLAQEYWERENHRDDYLVSRGYTVLHIQFTDIRDYPRKVRRGVRRWTRRQRYQITTLKV